MDYFLWDFENLKAENLANFPNIKEGDVLYLFYSDACKTISLDFLTSLQKLKVNFFFQKVKNGTKNALDLQLASFIGYLIGQNQGNSIVDKYYIVSNDKDYDCICSFWPSVKRIGLSAESTHLNINPQTIAIPIISPIVNTKAEINQTKIPSEKSEIELAKCLSKDEDPKKVAELLSKVKTKTALNSELNRYFKDGKKTSSILKKLSSFFGKDGKIL